MTVQFVGEGGLNNQRGEKLVAKYVHSGNTVLPAISSVDWTTGTITFASAHGLSSTSATQVLVCPVGWDYTNPFLNIRAIPMEWLWGNTTSASQQAIKLKYVDAVTAQVVKNDGTTAVGAVNTTSTENTGNIDITKIQFEIPSATSWAISGFLTSPRLHIRILGYYSNQYRYMKLKAQFQDGTMGYLDQYLQLLGLSTMSPTNVTNGIFGLHEFKIELTQMQWFFEFDNPYTGRRGGYGTFVTSTAREQNKLMYNQSKPVQAIIGFETFGSSYQFLSNGSIIEIYDRGL